MRSALTEAAGFTDQPTKEGWWYAMLIEPIQMPDGEDWGSTGWDIVQVVDNNGAPGSGEELMVMVGGVAKWQPLDAFVWGYEIPYTPPNVDPWAILKEQGKQ